MKFGPNHYVPVLKIKRGEKAALRTVSRAVQSRTTPLLEIVERKALAGKPPPKLANHLVNAFTKLDAAVAPYKRYFLDCREIAPDGASAAADLFKRAAAIKTPFTPVTGISRTADVKAALAHRNNGTAIRLTRTEYEKRAESPAICQPSCRSTASSTRTWISSSTSVPSRA